MGRCTDAIVEHYDYALPAIRDFSSSSTSPFSCFFSFLASRPGGIRTHDLPRPEPLSQGS